ncbi:hypothetical protein D3C73_1224690 [compost metagenome]
MVSYSLEVVKPFSATDLTSFFGCSSLKYPFLTRSSSISLVSFWPCPEKPATCLRVNGIPSIQSMPISNAHFFWRRCLNSLSRRIDWSLLTSPLRPMSQLWILLSPPRLSLIDLPYRSPSSKWERSFLVKSESIVSSPCSKNALSALKVTGCPSRSTSVSLRPTINIRLRDWARPKPNESNTFQVTL